MKILIVEDEDNLLSQIGTYLKDNGFETISARSVQEAESALEQEPGLVLLDWRLPDGEGIDALREWRGRAIQIPVIMMTARADLVDRVLGLELGADDYMTKPFEPRELLARIRVQLRKASLPTRGQKLSECDLLAKGDIKVDLRKRTVRFQGQCVDLSKLEFDLLKLFLERPNQVISRLEIMNAVWGRSNYQTTRTIDFHVGELRRKIASDRFLTVRGVGFRFLAE